MDETQFLKLLGGGTLASALLLLLYIVGMRVVRALDRVCDRLDDVSDDVADFRAQFFAAHNMTPIPSPSERRRERALGGGRRAPTNPIAVDKPWER